MLTEAPLGESRRARVRRIAGFIIGGGLNTGVTYLIYLALHRVLSYQVAYLIAYGAGVLFSYVFNSSVVFHRSMTWRGLLAFPAVYVVQYLASAGVLALFVESFGVPAWWAPLLVSILMLPLTYSMMRFVLTRFNRT
jgi:putative flippase GtrA